MNGYETFHSSQNTFSSVCPCRFGQMQNLFVTAVGFTEWNRIIITVVPVAETIKNKLKNSVAALNFEASHPTKERNATKNEKANHMYVK